MKWEQTYETGIKQIDNEHKIIVQLINNLELSLQKGNEEKTAVLVLKNLADYVKIHFKNEERVMKKIGFLELSRHKRLHKDLVKQVANIIKDFKMGKPWTARELLGFLQHWLVYHIVEEDKKIGKFLNSILNST